MVNYNLENIYKLKINEQFEIWKSTKLRFYSNNIYMLCSVKLKNKSTKIVKCDIQTLFCVINGFLD